MNRFSITADIPEAPDRVWAVLADVERWPEWTPTVTRVRRLDQGPLAVGSRVRIHQPRLLPAIWRIVELADGRRFTWVTGSLGVRAIAEHLTPSARVVVVTRPRAVGPAGAGK